MSFVYIPRSGKQAQANREHKVRVAEREQKKKEQAERAEQERLFWARPENRAARSREIAEQNRIYNEQRLARLAKLERIDVWYVMVVTGQYPCFGCKVTYKHRNVFLCRIPYQGKEIYFCEECLLADMLGSDLPEEEARDVLEPHAKWLNGL